MTDKNALELSKAVRNKEISVAEAVSGYIERIEKTGNKYNAYITICKEAAMERAKAVQTRIDTGEKLSPLAGVPVALKDNISTQGIETTCASKMLQGYAPVIDATVTEKLQDAGMIVIGKLNMDEFAMGGSSETSVFGPVLNPWDTTRVAGGSSGGCAAAVASGDALLSLGSDTGGSIRQPCSFCGTTGIKPTYGAVSRYGAIALASSLDQIGPIGRNADDCAAILSVISGPDEKDNTCIIDKPFDFTDVNTAGKTWGIGTNEIKIALPRNYFGKGVDEDVKNAVLASAKEYEAAGAKIEEIDIPYLDYMVHVYYIITCAEASSNMARFDGLKYGYRSSKADTLSEVYRLSRNEGFGLEVKRRIMLGSFVLSSGYYDAYYKKALQLRTLIKNAFDGIFSKYDAILSPVAPTTAYKIGENIDDPIKMYMGDIFTATVNLAGVPAISMPCGFDRKGLPIGYQIIGQAFSEQKLVNIARVYQNRTDFHKKVPRIQDTAAPAAEGTL